MNSEGDTYMPQHLGVDGDINFDHIDANSV